MTGLRAIRSLQAWGFACAVAVAACGRQPSQTASTQTAPAGPPTIEVARVVEKPLDVTLDMPGELQAYETVAIVPKIAGFVKTIHVDRGSRVRAGEVMAQLEAPELLAQHAEAESKLQSAEAQLGVARSKADAEAGTFEKLKAAAATPGVVAGNDLIVAQKSVEGAQNQVSAAQKNVDAARHALDAVTGMESYLRVTAPFDGVVTERNVHPGALVGPGSGADSATPMLRVVDVHRLRLLVPVPEAYIAGVAAGTEMPFTVPAFPGQTFTGTIARTAHAVDVRTRTMAVELDVTNTDGRLAPGTFAQIKWRVHRPQPSLFVPSSSVTNTTSRNFVVRVRDGHADWVDITTGLAADTLVEVFGDLRAGEQVAVRGTDEIRPGAEVHVKVPPPVPRE